MSKPRGWRVTATLATPLAGEPPMLDGLLEYIVANRKSGGVRAAINPGSMDRSLPCPPPGLIPICISRRDMGGWPVPCCSSPILGHVAREWVEHYAKRLAVEHADILHPAQRTVLTMTNGQLKSYRLPLRVRAVDAVHWICLANYREMKKQCRRINAIGKKRSLGYGRIAEWTFTPHDGDAWFVAHDTRVPILMRVLPFGKWLPANLTGAKRDYGACVPPYWHPERYTEIVSPC